MKLKASFTAPLFVLILYALIFASDFIKDRLIEAGGNIYLSVIILQILIFLLPAIVFCRLKGVGYAVRLNIRLFSPGKLGCAIVAGLAMILGSVLIRLGQIYLGGQTSFTFSMFDAYLLDSGSQPEFLFTAMAFAVMPALTEELVFRSILLTEYNEGGYSAVSATVITSLLCSMMYFSPELLPIRLLASIIFCMVTYATGSSLAALLSHLIFNIYGIFGEHYLMKALIDPSNKIIGIFTFAMLFLVFLIILFGELEHTARQAGRSGTPTPSYRLKKTEDGKTPDISATEAAEEHRSHHVVSEQTRLAIEAYFSPTFLLCLLVFVISIFGFI